MHISTMSIPWSLPLVHMLYLHSPTGKINLVCSLPFYPLRHYFSYLLANHPSLQAQPFLLRPILLISLVIIMLTIHTPILYAHLTPFYHHSSQRPLLPPHYHRRLPPLLLRHSHPLTYLLATHSLGLVPQGLYLRPTMLLLRLFLPQVSICLLTSHPLHTLFVLLCLTICLIPSHC